MLGFEEVSGNPGLECYTARDIRAELIEQVREAGRTRELPAGLVDCMVITMRRLPGDQIRRLSESRSESRAEAALGRLWQACARQVPEASSS